jgi:hypothetical protein
MDYLLGIRDIARQSLKLGDPRRCYPSHKLFGRQALLQEPQHSFDEYPVLYQRQIG